MTPSTAAPLNGIAGSLTLAVVIPTLNERDNIEPLIKRLESVLNGISWEAIFVDDDSRDGTAELLRQTSLHDPRIRVLQRIGRRGLASACLEGMMASAAPYLAVMDADLQHDESLLPKMLDKLRESGADLVVASRNLGADGMGEFAASRVVLSRLGARLSRVITKGVALTDPMSGFFMLRREYLSQVIHRTSGIGFKILLDLIASGTGRPKVCEIPYRFRNRERGASKLDFSVSIEYLYLLIDKLFGQFIPVRFIAFVLAGLPGLMLHLATLGLSMQVLGSSFLQANVSATFVAMTLNFFVNNLFTWHDARLKGKALVGGLLAFYLACSVGSVTSFALAQFLFEKTVPWYLAGMLGMAVASVWNYGASQILSWRRLLRVRQP